MLFVYWTDARKLLRKHVTKILRGGSSDSVVWAKNNAVKCWETLIPSNAVANHRDELAVLDLEADVEAKVDSLEGDDLELANNRLEKTRRDKKLYTEALAALNVVETAKSKRLAPTLAVPFLACAQNVCQLMTNQQDLGIGITSVFDEGTCTLQTHFFFAVDLAMAIGGMTCMLGDNSTHSMAILPLCYADVVDAWIMHVDLCLQSNLDEDVKLSMLKARTQELYTFSYELGELVSAAVAQRRTETPLLTVEVVVNLMRAIQGIPPPHPHTNTLTHASKTAFTYRV